MKISIYTLGCKLNQAESQYLSQDLESAGFEVVKFGTDENVAIIRACGVTMGASATTREIIRRAKKNKAKVIATGCLENNELPEIDFVAKDNKEILKIILGLQDKNIEISQKLKKNKNKKTRALVKIQTGCNFNCAYCIIPHFRGKSASLTPAEIINKIKDLEKRGYKEITLTGVNICQYKHEKKDLADLLDFILKETIIPRIRLGSLDPRLITASLITLYSKNSRLMPHWHLSLQSGSNKILTKMNRHYTAQKYFEITESLRQTNPLFSFTADIIVGFPGETDEDFKESCKFVKKVQLTKIHVFPYSPRPKTPAAIMTDQVQDSIKTKRVKELLKISNEVGREFKKRFIGLKREILFENKRNGYWFGFTPEYIKIKKRSFFNLSNRIKLVKIKNKYIL